MDIVTAYPRSGTGYTARLLQAANVDMGHEKVGIDGVVSWLHIGHGSVPWIDKPIMDQVWDKIIHIVRDPIKVISSAQTLSDESFEYMFNVLNDHPGGERSIRWYMWTWLKWNEFIESRVPDYRFRVEDLKVGNPALDGFLRLFGVMAEPELPKENTNSRPHSILTWLDLKTADSCLCKKVREKALEYGYKPFTFGAVMMAKDEEKNIRRCLESVRPIVDEIILVDTGSKDKTVEIAKEFGATIFHHPWQNNFSLHRNQTLKYSNCDWVIQIDCDEELKGNRDELRKYVEVVSRDTDYNAIAVQLRDIHGGKQTMQFNASRIFKRGAVHFEDIVHNRPVFKGDAAMPQGEPDYFLHHYGYDLNEDQKQKKLIRTRTLLEKRIKNNKKDYEAYFYLAQIEGQSENPQAVLDLISFYIKNRERCKKFNRSALYTHLQAIVAVHGYDNEEFKAVLNQYMNEMPFDLDITFMAFMYAREVKNIDLLLRSAKRFIDNYIRYSEDPHSQASRFTYSYQPEYLAEAYFHATTISFSQGIAGLKFFGNILQSCGDEFSEKAKHDMKKACENLGVQWEIN